MPFDDVKNGHGHTTNIDITEQAEVSAGAVDEKVGTTYDQRDMSRLGKRQELRRNFQFFSIFGYAVILGYTWEWALASGVFSLTNGGTAGAVWMFLIVCIFMFFVMLSMAEMASMAPTSGGQYHWVSEFSPATHQKILSYVTGWFALLGWQTSLVGTAYAAAQHFEAMAALSDPNFVIKGWYGTMFTIALSMIAICCNTLIYRKMPLIEGIVLVFHVSGFLAVVVVLWVMGPRGDSSVLTTFSDNGWGSVGLSCLVGILGPIITLIGADSQCHLSEELYDAAYVLPRAMVATATANYLMGFVMILTLVFTLGPDVDAVVSTRLGVPWVQVLYNATNNYAATMVLTFIVGLLLTCCLINNVTTASRQLWSFARDGGIPGASWFAQVRPGWDVPFNAMLFTFGFTIILSLFIIGSPVAFSILTSLSLTGLISSYLMAIGCIFAKRLRGESFPVSRFNLGKFGLVANTIALCFLVVIWVFMFFPTAPSPGAAGMNWSVVIYGGVVILFTTYYFVRGRSTYAGPVAYVRKDLQ
ncbi:hypothetical protein LTR08_002249 [Meristemomyces frigidus]|nr:hypothetical protein LTR08_002249 [Meristemomyces frigidus]